MLVKIYSQMKAIDYTRNSNKPKPTLSKFKSMLLPYIFLRSCPVFLNCVY